jgi:hypothetical protein
MVANYHLFSGLQACDPHSGRVRRGDVRAHGWNPRFLNAVVGLNEDSNCRSPRGFGPNHVEVFSTASRVGR